MDKDVTRSNAFFAILGGGAILVHALAMIWLLWTAMNSGRRVDEGSFLTSFLVTAALLGVGLAFLHLAHHERFSIVVVYSTLGAAYTLLGIIFFAVAALCNAVHFTKEWPWCAFVASQTFI